MERLHVVTAEADTELGLFLERAVAPGRPAAETIAEVELPAEPAIIPLLTGRPS